MRTGKIDFSHFPDYQKPPENTHAGDVVSVPYLDINGEDEPIDFLFNIGDKYGIIARANIHTLQGTKKVGKSAAGLALIVAALKGKFIGITANRENMDVLWIDTEQDKSTLRKKARAVLEMAGITTQPEHLKIVTLRGYGGPEEALAATLQAIADNKADFVFLDGVVDLCRAFNDEEKSRDVVRQLETYAEKYGVAILGLIHTNKRDNEARGHLGAIMQQKSAEIYQVNKEGDIAQVTQPFSRFAPVPPLSFSFADDFKIAPAVETINKAKDESRARFSKLFKAKERLTKGELIEEYMKAQECEESKAEKDIKAAVIAGVLDKAKEGRKAFYTFVSPFTDFKDIDEDYI